MAPRPMRSRGAGVEGADHRVGHAGEARRAGPGSRPARRPSRKRPVDSPRRSASQPTASRHRGQRTRSPASPSPLARAMRKSERSQAAAAGGVGRRGPGRRRWRRPAPGSRARKTSRRAVRGTCPPGEPAGRGVLGPAELVAGLADGDSSLPGRAGLERSRRVRTSSDDGDGRDEQRRRDGDLAAHHGVVLHRVLAGDERHAVGAGRSRRGPARRGRAGPPCGRRRGSSDPRSGSGQQKLSSARSGRSRAPAAITRRTASSTPAGAMAMASMVGVVRDDALGEHEALVAAVVRDEDDRGVGRDVAVHADDGLTTVRPLTSWS